MNAKSNNLLDVIEKELLVTAASNDAKALHVLFYNKRPMFDTY